MYSGSHPHRMRRWERRCQGGNDLEPRSPQDSACLRARGTDSRHRQWRKASRLEAAFPQLGPSDAVPMACDASPWDWDRFKRRGSCGCASRACSNLLVRLVCRCPKPKSDRNIGSLAAGGDQALGPRTRIVALGGVTCFRPLVRRGRWLRHGRCLLHVQRRWLAAT